MPARFTIAIPTHNRRGTVLLAVRSALAQTRSPERIIVLCDGCEDGTAEAVRGLGPPIVEVVELPKASGYAYGHRNRALEMARGEVILWLADDDLLLPNHLEEIGAVWDLGRFDLVQSDAVLVRADDSLGWFAGDWSLPQGRARLLTANSNPMAAVSVRVDIVRAAGGWDATLPRCADWDLWQRLVERGARTARCPEPTVLHFRATDRVQAWEDRVRQNSAWLERISVPASLADLRLTLVQARSRWEADLLDGLTAAEQTHAGLRTQLDSLQAELDSLQAELDGSRSMLDASRAELTRAQDEATAHADTLARIYAGGWWRLRGHLGPLRSAYRGLRAVSRRL